MHEIGQLRRRERFIESHIPVYKEDHTGQHMQIARQSADLIEAGPVFVISVSIFAIVVVLVAVLLFAKERLLGWYESSYR